MALKTINLEDLKDIYDLPYIAIVDIRSNDAFNEGHIPGSINIPVDQLKDNIDKIPQNKSLYVVCEKGGQSIGATILLAGQGVPACCVTSGGMRHWIEKGLPITNGAV